MNPFILMRFRRFSRRNRTPTIRFRSKAGRRAVPDSLPRAVPLPADPVRDRGRVRAALRPVTVHLPAGIGTERETLCPEVWKT